MEELISQCEECEGVAEWTYCANHKEADFICYRVACMSCDWAEHDCDTTEHCEIIK